MGFWKIDKRRQILIFRSLFFIPCSEFIIQLVQILNGNIYF